MLLTYKAVNLIWRKKRISIEANILFDYLLDITNTGLKKTPFLCVHTLTQFKDVVHLHGDCRAPDNAGKKLEHWPWYGSRLHNGGKSHNTVHSLFTSHKALNVSSLCNFPWFLWQKYCALRLVAGGMRNGWRWFDRIDRRIAGYHSTDGVYMTARGRNHKKGIAPWMAWLRQWPHLLISPDYSVEGGEPVQYRALCGMPCQTTIDTAAPHLHLGLPRIDSPTPW